LHLRFVDIETRWFLKRQTISRIERTFPNRGGTANWQFF
jgi:hypothetical protein